MAGSRRIQRSVRVTVAGAFMVSAALSVVAAVLSTTSSLQPALFSVLAGGLAVRIVSSEVVQTRRDAAGQRAELARAFREEGPGATRDT